MTAGYVIDKLAQFSYVERRKDIVRLSVRFYFGSYTLVDLCLRRRKRMKTVIITGANSGLGFETAKKIAKTGDYQVILACRNMEKAGNAKKVIMSESGNEQIFEMELDTSSLSSVRSFVEKYVNRGFGTIDGLLCNAGINGKHTGITADGFDVVFETNHLGHFLLTNLLLPYMSDNGRIFLTSSDMHDAPMTKMVWHGTDALAHPDESMAKDSIRYSYSKLCNLYFVYEMAGRLNRTGSKVRINAFNPGLMKTNFMPLTKASMAFVKMSMPERYGDLEKSSTAYAQLVTEDGLVVQSGQYYDRSIHTKRTSELSYHVENAKELWAKSAEYTRL